MLFVLSFSIGRKLEISICCINANIFIVYRNMFIVSNNIAVFDITFIPLLVQYIINITNNVQLIKNGVLYKNWDNIKLLMLYNNVIARDINNNEKMRLIIKPIFFPNSEFIFSFYLGYS